MIKKISKSAVMKIPSSQYGSAIVGGDKLSPVKLKKFITGTIKSGGMSVGNFKKELIKAGVTGSQESKRAKLIKLATGDNEHKMTWKEERAWREEIKMRIAAARASSEIGTDSASVAMKLGGRRSGGVDGKKAALSAVLEKGGVKTTHHALGIKDKEYGVSIGQETSGQGLKHRASIGQKNESRTAFSSGGGAQKMMPNSGGLASRGTRPMGM